MAYARFLCFVFISASSILLTIKILHFFTEEENKTENLREKT